jgi:hypothetical protein
MTLLAKHAIRLTIPWKVVEIDSQFLGKLIQRFLATLGNAGV